VVLRGGLRGLSWLWRGVGGGLQLGDALGHCEEDGVLSFELSVEAFELLPQEAVLVLEAL
jgi:hypothetical protein